MGCVAVLNGERDRERERQRERQRERSRVCIGELGYEREKQRSVVDCHLNKNKKNNDLGNDEERER